MSMFSSVDGIISKYGCDVKIAENGNMIDGKAFVQPLRYKNRVYVGGRYHILGLNKSDKYLYVGQVENNLIENHTVIESHNCKYIVRRCEKYYVNNSPVYVWAILAPYGEVLEDDYESD